MRSRGREEDGEEGDGNRGGEEAEISFFPIKRNLFYYYFFKLIFHSKTFTLSPLPISLMLPHHFPTSPPS